MATTYNIYNNVGKCRHCGRRFWLQGFNEQNRIAYNMAKYNICYDCAFWEDLLAYPPMYMEVLGNVCVRLHPVADKKDKALLLGGKGKMRYFMKLSGGLIQSNDIWIIGTVPERFKSVLNPTVTEISKKAFHKLSRTDRRCYGRACLDRYNCYRYERSIERESGPFNAIPPKWKVGDEHCGFFINLDEFKFDNNCIDNKPILDGTKD